jgi:putative heme-binding domain-containing protein
LTPENAVTLRLAAADAFSRSHLTPVQLVRLCNTIQTAGPLELNRLLTPFEFSREEQVGLKLVSSLTKSPALPSLRMDLLRATLAKYGPAVEKAIDELEPLVNVDVAAQRERIEEMLPLVKRGDVRRGHAVYYSSKAACSSCHRLGHVGGTTGPELTHMGDSRTERDLLESILYPSLSFVRSYEPMLIITDDGKTTNGVIIDETEHEYILATGPDEEARVKRADVEQLVPSMVSLMPAGLDKQLTPQEFADLVVFLKSATSEK